MLVASSFFDPLALSGSFHFTLGYWPFRVPCACTTFQRLGAPPHTACQRCAGPRNFQSLCSDSHCFLCCTRSRQSSTSRAERCYFYDGRKNSFTPARRINQCLLLFLLLRCEKNAGALLTFDEGEPVWAVVLNIVWLFRGSPKTTEGTQRLGL